MSTTVVGPPAATEQVPGRPQRLHSLTGLRILAALAVYFSHVPTPRGAPHAVQTFMTSGYMGVTVFFTLSGFVLTINYFHSLLPPSRRQIVKYAVARFARIYPLYLLILLAVFVHMGLQGKSLHGWIEHVLMLQAWSAHDSEAFAFNAPAWSVSVELFLYACFPLVVLALARVRSSRALVLLGLGVLAAMTLIVTLYVARGNGHLPWSSNDSAHRWLYRMPVTRLGDFVLGALIARLYLRARDQPHIGRIGAVLSIVGAATIVFLMTRPGLLFTPWSWDLAYVIPSLAVIFGLSVAPASAFSRALSWPVVVLLGEASYALYLCHQQLLGFPGVAGFQTTLPRELPVLLVILGVAIALHKLVERPARTWIRNQRFLQP